MSRGSHWGEHTSRWSRIRPPLRPDADVVAVIRGQLDGHQGPTLLLGVTPELAGIADDLTAVDRNREVVANLWPGDTEGRRAVAAAWSEIPGIGRTFRAAIGDGSPNCDRHPEATGALFAMLAEVVAPGGRIAFRVFATPEAVDSVDAVCAAAAAGRAGVNFHAFKWQLAMAIVGEAGDPSIAVTTILGAFEAAFPDRDALAEANGWSRDDIDTIDVYRGSPEVYSFPTEAELASVIPAAFTRVGFVPAGRYDLAERCPILVADRT